MAFIASGAALRGSIVLACWSLLHREEFLCIGMAQRCRQHLETAAGTQLCCKLLNSGHRHQRWAGGDGDPCDAHAFECRHIGMPARPVMLTGASIALTKVATVSGSRSPKG